jgi:hypothetical protein
MARGARDCAEGEVTMRRYLTGASPAERLAARWRPKGSRRVLAKADGVSVVYVYEGGGRFYALAFRGTAARPDFHHSFRLEAQRDAAVRNFLASVTENTARKAERAAKERAVPNPYKVSDIVHTSWGYDQTNVEFFVVTRVSPSCVWVCKIASDYRATGFESGKTWPAMPIQIVGPETRHTVRGGSFSIAGHATGITSGEVHCSSYA